GFPAYHTVVILLFLFSGISGLIYEVLWTRMFSLVLGTTVYAVATVLGVYMGGLALGSWFFGRIVDRPGANGFRLYAWLEGAVGVYAFILPFLIDLSDEIYKIAWPLLSESFAGQMSLRLGLAVMTLIVPTTLMGGTLPALSRYLVRSRDRSGVEIGTLYAVNTLGAVIGCFITGFFLIELLGVRMTLTTAAILNLTVALSALYLSGRSHPEETENRQKKTKRQKEKTIEVTTEYSRRQIRAVLWLFALSGFTALALEVLWTRSLMYFVNVDTWAFTSMLTAFLSGIGVGSFIMARFADRIKKPLLTLAAIEILIGITASLSIPLFDLLYSTRNTGLWLASSGNILLGQIAHKLFHSFIIMLVPTLLMGAAFPLVCRIYVGNRKEIGRGTGTLYALNTAGAILGSVGAAFVMLPLMGNIQSSILLSASLYVVIGLLLLIVAIDKSRARLRVRVFAITGLAVLVFLNVLFAGQPVIKLTHFFKEQPGLFTLRYFREGPDASIAVLEKANGLRELNINGHSTAFTNYMDMQVHRMLSHLPVLLHHDPKKVLIIGFGMGSTVWGCCQYNEVERVDVVELLRDEKETAYWFEEVNHGVLDHSKLKFIQGDGRNYLLGSREKYDVISFNGIHPRYSANLYTVDFYRMCREKITSNGIICAWMTQNALVDVEWRMLCRSFTEVFPYSTLWYCNPQHFCLIGSMKPLKINFDNWQERIAQDEVAADLRDSNLEDPFVFITRYMFGNEELHDYLAESPLNTDDKPLVEFARESIREERAIINELINLKEDVLSLLEEPRLSEQVRNKLNAYDQGSRWMMRGQIETWYPTGPFESEIAQRKALLFCPDNQDVRHNLNFSEQITEKVQKALDKKPNHPTALFDLGRIAMEKGDFEKAEEYLLRSLAIRKGMPEASFQLGLLRLFQGRLEESAGILQELLKSTPGTPPIVSFAYCEAMIRLGVDVDKAIRGKESIAKNVPNIAEYFELKEKTALMMRKRQKRENQ
ncbi:MAG: fused MFS/spermidine synthase, partial [Candidatus Zixiibacteriota bacterium]